MTKLTDDTTHEIILHHFDASPFAEKVRLALGIKGLSWKTVQIPMIMPKPKLMPLTGGYRKTPVMQIGAEIFCDSNLIIEELELRFPEKSLYPNNEYGLVRAFSNWSDIAFFQPGAGLSMGLNEGLPEPLLNDRKIFFKFMDFSTLSESIPHLHGQFLAQLANLEHMLAKEQKYLCGNSPGALDILAYFPVWMARANFPAEEQFLSSFSALLQWERRMATIGHGNPQECSEDYALDSARHTTPPALADANEAELDDKVLGLQANQLVNITPTDYGEVAVQGRLKILNHHKVVIQREDAQIGLSSIHFPRSGFAVSAA